MGNTLYYTAQDPNAYPIVKRAFKTVSQVTSNRVIHVMSYNILADRLATQYHHSETPTELLHLMFRRPRIL